MGKRRLKSHKDKHHIIPISRGGSSRIENIAQTEVLGHQKYHSLFSNQTPTEIIGTLVKQYWNNDWGYVERAYSGRTF